jgi:outer membrane lipoprotein LolB
LNGGAGARRAEPARTAAVVAAALLLSACAALSPPRPAPELSGRLALRVEAGPDTPARSFAADFELRGDAARGELSLTGPLGATLAQLRWQPGSARWVQPQGESSVEREYPTLDALSRDLLGEPLPLAALVDWLRGRPWPGAPSTARGDGFEQLGWRIGLAQAAEGVILATRERPPAVTVRARLERPEAAR